MTQEQSGPNITALQESTTVGVIDTTNDEHATLLLAMQKLGIPTDFADKLIDVITQTAQTAVNTGLKTGTQVGYDGAITMLKQHGLETAAAVLTDERDQLLAQCAAVLKEIE